jgi:UDP-glucose 4-epimerase
MRILVTGASGYIGERLIETLREKEWVERIVGLDIRESPLRHRKLRSIKRDIREQLDDIFTAERIDAVAHLAFVVPPIHDKGLMEEINKGGLRNTLDASARSGVRQILHASSTTAYGFHADNDDPLTEESPLRGNDDFTYSKNKKENEQILREFRSAHPQIIVSNLRPCFVIGPKWVNPLATHVTRKIVMLPSKTAPTQFVHRDDLVNVMALMLEKRIDGDYNVAGEGTITFPEIVRRLGNIALPLPWAILKHLNDLAWFLRLSFMTPSPSAGMHVMIHPWLATSEKLIRDTGYDFMYDSRAAFEHFARSQET